MKKFKTKRKGTNKGFSLIEVLAAVVILGLIATPILQMFYSSYSTNQKSKKYLAAADLAQTTMEAVSAQTWHETKSITDTVVYPGLKEYYENIPSTKGHIYKNPLSSFEGPEYETVYSQLETANRNVLPNVAQNTCMGYYFYGVDYGDEPRKPGEEPKPANDKFFVRLSFDTRNFATDGFYPVEVYLEVYRFTGKRTETPPEFKPNKSSGKMPEKYSMIKSISTYVPSSRSVEQ